MDLMLLKKLFFPMNKAKNIYGLSDLEKSLVIPDGATTIEYGKRRLNWKGKLGYKLMVWRSVNKLNTFYREALKKKQCYYGPFKGEFGHFLLHNLPFLVHLHKNGVKIHYCGMELHKPFLVDETGKSIIHEWFPLPDFFAEAKPMANETVLPPSIKKLVDDFKKQAIGSDLPFLDISEKDMYWFVFRNWQLEGKQEIYDLSKVYAKSKGKSCVIFPRKKGVDFSPNNGGPWDYFQISKMVSLFFEKVYLVGHPSLSADVEASGNIELKVSLDNSDTLRYCAEADLIITQHSGAVHLGAYVKTPVLIIFNGDPPIKGLIDTIRFRKNITSQSLNYAFNFAEIENFANSGTF